MGRKLNLSHLSEEETDRILSVLQKDYEVRQAEKDRLGSFEHTLQKEQNKTQVLAQQTKFNKNCCIRCCQVFGLIFNRRRQCYHCGYNICKDCCDYQADTKHYVCHVCVKEKELDKQTCSWFYNAAGHKFKRCGSAKVVRSLYKTTSYCKLRHALTQGGLKNIRTISRIRDTNYDKNKLRSRENTDTELESGYSGSGQSRSYNVTTRTKVRPPLPDEFRDDREDRGDEDDDEDSDELPSSSPSTSTRHPPPSSPTTRSLGKSPASRAGSLDTLNLLSSSSSSSLPSSSRQLRTRTPDPEKSKPLRASDRGKSGSSESLRSRSKWDRDSHGRDKVKKDTKDIYRHAFESARKAEEYKFKAKFDALLNDLHRTLDAKSPRGLSDSFASTSYGEVMLSFRGRVKDLLIGFNQRLQLAYESFENQDAPGDHGPEVKQYVSRFLEDLLGESLDLTSDEAVSDLSSLSDDSANDRHVYEDQIAQAVVSKILENHRREVSHTLGQERRLGGHLNSPSLVPSALDDDDDDYDNRRSPPDDVDVKDTDISKDFEDLKNFVQETQSRSRLYDDRSSDSLDGGGGLDDSGDEARPSARQGSSFDTYSSSREQSLPDFSEFDQIDFNSAELDPDLLQMNLGVIVEETEEELEAEATDTHWRENWIFKGTGVSPYDNALVNKHIRGNNDDQPQYMMVPRPDDNLAPRIGNKDVDQLSDLSDNEDLTDDDNSFYPRTSEELARISRHKRSSTPPSLSSPSLIPNHHNNHDNDEDDDDDFLAPKRKLTPMPKGRPSQNLDVDLDFEDIGVGTEDFVGPIVEPSAKELKLLEELVPADDDDPRFVVTPDSVTIQEGEPVKLSCRVAGTSPIDVFWYREQDEVEELEESEDVELQVDGDRNLATLYNVGKRQAGQYMCIALSDKGKAIKYLTVTVKDNKQELKKPEFLKELKDVEVLEGQSVKFRCKVKGYPQPRINWYKDGNLLRSNKSCRIEKFGNRDYILTIDCATMDDDAEYMVLAKNVAGEVRSTAQVIVEPYSENHPWLSKSRSHSISTVNTDSESDRPNSTQLDDSLIYPARSSPFRDSNRSFNTPRSPAPEEEKVDGLVSKVTAARNNVRMEAEGMLATAEELTALNQHLEDMERHLDNLEGRNSPKSSNPSHDNVDYSALVDEATALRMIEDEKEMGQAAKGVRKMTSSALSVLRAAEEIIEGERKAMDSPSSPSPPLSKRDNSAPFSSLTEENNNKSVSLAPELTQSQLTSHSDLNKSVSSGYGTNSMASSAVEDNESVAGSQVSQQEDEFAMYLPPLDDDISGSYREEVSISLSSKKPSGAPFSSSPASSSGSSTLTNSYSSSSSSSAKTVQSSQPTSTPARNSTMDSAVSSSRRPPVSEQIFAASTDEPDSHVNTMLPDSLTPGREAGEEDLVLNFGPKEIDSRTYGRDYEVKPMRQKSVEGEGNEGEGSEHKRWSVSLDPFSPVAEVVNRQPSVEETEEKIYLTAGKMYHLEDRVKELESRVQGEGEQASPRTMAALQDQVAKTAAQVARSEKDVSSIERAVNTLQFSPRSSRGSNSSTSSTPRESIDSGVSSFTPERHERPLPTHMVGQTQEEEVPESRAEYDADSGIELPSVSRLRAMFGSNKKEDDSSEGNFKRIHSITARSLSKDQLQKLREAGNTNMTDIIRIRDQPAQSTASVQLRSKPVGAGAGHPDRRSYPQGAASATLSPAELQQQQKGGPRQNRTPNLPGPAHYQQLDPSKDPVLIYPEEHEGGQDSAASSAPKPTRLRTRSRSPPPRSGTPRPKSAVILSPPSAGLSNHANRPAASRPRAQSSSEASGSQENLATPRIRSGCISARAAFWERRIMQGEATDTNVEEEFPEMVEDSEA